jgi:hypothetical protein
VENLAPEQPGIEDPNVAIAERLRQSADQKASLARLAIDQQEERIALLQDRLDDLTKQGLPTEEVTVQLENAKFRLEDSKEDLARAEEAKENINPGMGASRGEVPAHLDHDQGMGGAGEHHSVRSALGNRVQNVAGGRKQAPKLK